MKNIETVQSIYSAFGKGDVAAILATSTKTWSGSTAPSTTACRGLRAAAAAEGVRALVRTMVRRALSLENYTIAPAEASNGVDVPSQYHSLILDEG
jgi:hypothetical protein